MEQAISAWAGRVAQAASPTPKCHLTSETVRHTAPQDAANHQDLNTTKAAVSTDNCRNYSGPTTIICNYHIIPLYLIFLG